MTARQHGMCGWPRQRHDRIGQECRACLDVLLLGICELMEQADELGVVVSVVGVLFV